jgi:signal transduction histidine kinase
MKIPLSLLIFLIIALLIAIFFLLKKFLKIKRENSLLKRELNFWIDFFSNYPFPLFIIEKDEIKWQNKKALEILGDLRGKKKDQIELFLKDSYWDSQVFFLSPESTVYLLIDKREEKILKRSYEIALAYLSHELKTPFTMVKNYAEKLEEKLKEIKSFEALLKDFEALKNSLEKVERLIYKLFSSLEYLVKDLKIKKEKFSLKPAIEEVIFWVTPLCKDKNIELEVDIPEDIEIEGDKEWLMQAILNPLENAIKFSPPGEKVILKVYRRENDWINILIRDMGPGVAYEELPFLGMPFFKSSAEKGLGFGLFLTKKIVSAHGGKLRFNLPFQGGLEVLIEIPYNLKRVSISSSDMGFAKRYP